VSCELQIPCSAFHDVAIKWSKLILNRFQMHQKVHENVFYSSDFSVGILSQIGDSVYVNSVCISDEASVHISGKANCHNCHIWGLQSRHDVREHDWDSPEINMWCGLIGAGLIRLFFFHEETVIGAVYCDMLENWAVPQVHDRYIFQNVGALPHFWTLDPEFFNG
jgi:hypothetical protein